MSIGDNIALQENLVCQARVSANRRVESIDPLVGINRRQPALPLCCWFLSKPYPHALHADSTNQFWIFKNWHGTCSREGNGGGKDAPHIETLARIKMNMLKKLTLAALLLTFAGFTTSYAQFGNGPGDCTGDNFVDVDGDGYNDNAPDADGDGIPNYYDEDYVPGGTGGNGGGGNGDGSGFIDEDGDGICDNMGDGGNKYMYKKGAQIDRTGDCTGDGDGLKKQFKGGNN
jgi:hypothetical protein